MNECRTLSALLAALMLAPAAHGLTLEQAVELARARAPQLQARAAALDAAQARAVAAGRLPDPELVMGIDNLPVTTDDAWSTTRDFMTMRKLGVMQSFPNAQKRHTQRETAQAAILVARSQARQTQLEIAQATARAWVDVYAADRLEENLKALRPELELQAQAVNAALRAGRASSVDALTAQAAIFELDDRLLDAHREARSSRAMLARWIGDEAQSIRLAPAPSFEVLSSARETVLATLHQHASLVAYESQIALAQSEVDLARAEKRADWSAELAYAKRGDAFSDMVSLEFRVGLPLFSRHRQDPLILAKRAEVTQLEAQREAQLRMHSEEVTSTLVAWQSARDRVDLYQRERLPLARQRSKVALASYQAGGTPLADVLASIVAEVQIQQTYAELLRELGRSWASLRYLELPEVSP